MAPSINTTFPRNTKKEIPNSRVWRKKIIRPAVTFFTKPSLGGETIFSDQSIGASGEKMGRLNFNLETYAYVPSDSRLK